MSETAIQSAGTESLAGVSPQQAKPLAPGDMIDPVKGEPLTDIGQINGNPLCRFHPLHGRRVFADANEFYAAGGEDGDWRFKTAAAADAARTDAEAMQTWHRNVRAKLSAHAEEGRPVVQNSVAAQESLDSGFPEPGLVPENS